LRYQEILEACWKGYRQVGMKDKGGRQVPNCVPVSENEVRHDADNFSPNDNALDRLHHEFIPTWQILNHKVLKTAYNFADDDTALEFVQAIKLMGERMDHNGVITLDNAQVTVEVTTHDVNGLTRLDFEYALKAHDLANKMNGDQEPHPTNSLEAIEEDLKKWFKEKWVRFGPDGKIRGDCARGSSKEGKPKCLPQSKAHALGKKGRASSASKKRREDPNAERRGAAKNVATRVNEFAPDPEREDDDIPDQILTLANRWWNAGDKQPQITNVLRSLGWSIAQVESEDDAVQLMHNDGTTYFISADDFDPDVFEQTLDEKQDACYSKVKSRYKVWPSAYASGALVQCRKKGAANWGNKKK
jgi:pterin-4a-carbinolamine dehydratase